MVDMVRNEVVTVGTTAISISPAQQRKNIYLRNVSTGAQVITITFSNNQIAVANAGFVLNPGEYITDSDSGSTYEAWDGAISAISSVAGGSLAVVERI